MTTKFIFKTCSHTNVHNSFLLPQIFSLNTKQYKLIKIKKNQADELQKKNNLQIMLHQLKISFPILQNIQTTHTTSLPKQLTTLTMLIIFI